MIDLTNREQVFPVLQEGVLFLNHAGTSPIPRPTADLMQQQIEEHASQFTTSRAVWSRRMSDAVSAMAELIGAPNDSIALMPNTTTAVATVANGLSLQEGDRVVGLEGEYPANVYPWRRLEQSGVSYIQIPARDDRFDYEEIESALSPPTKVLAVSSVMFASGLRLDLSRLGEMCRKQDVFLFVDAIQSLGAFEMNVVESKIDFLATGSQKWMLGPMGAGFLYVRPEVLDRVKVTVQGADSMIPETPYLDYESKRLKPGARRFQGGTIALVTALGLGRSVRLLLDYGIADIQQRIQVLTDILVEGLTAKGYACHSPRGEGEGSGIVMFTHPRLSPGEVAQRLQDRNIVAIEREGRLRLSPHFYLVEEEMERVVDAAP